MQLEPRGSGIAQCLAFTLPDPAVLGSNPSVLWQASAGYEISRNMYRGAINKKKLMLKKKQIVVIAHFPKKLLDLFYHSMNFFV